MVNADIPSSQTLCFRVRKMIDVYKPDWCEIREDWSVYLFSPENRWAGPGWGLAWVLALWGRRDCSGRSGAQVWSPGPAVPSSWVHPLGPAVPGLATWWEKLSGHPGAYRDRGRGIPGYSGLVASCFWVGAESSEDGEAGHVEGSSSVRCQVPGDLSCLEKP